MREKRPAFVASHDDANLFVPFAFSHEYERPSEKGWLSQTNADEDLIIRSVFAALFLAFPGYIFSFVKKNGFAIIQNDFVKHADFQSL